MKTSSLNDIPIPLEIADPELGELFRQVAHKELKARISSDRVFSPNGEVLSPVPGRNDPCICGSGKKFKKCCGGVE